MTAHPLAAADHAADLPHPDFIPSLRAAEFGQPIPPQPTVERERLYRKQRLAAGYRLFARQGFDMGGAGHITVRDPEHPDRFWVNPAGVHFSHIRVSDLMLVDHTGEILEWGRVKRLNIAAFAIHSELHKARPDVVAAAHSHSLYLHEVAELGLGDYGAINARALVSGPIIKDQLFASLSYTHHSRDGVTEDPTLATTSTASAWTSSGPSCAGRRPTGST